MWHNNGQSFIEWFTIIFCVCDEYLYSNSGIINFVIEYAYHHVSIPIISLNKIRLRNEIPFLICNNTSFDIQLVRSNLYILSFNTNECTEIQTFCSAS